MLGAGEDPNEGLGELRPLEVVGGCSLRPADLWNLLSLLTTLCEVWVLTPTLPPYGQIGKMWVVPRRVETVTQRESGEKAMSCTDPGVSPL